METILGLLGDLGPLWGMILLVVAVVLSWVIAKFDLHSKIGKYVDHVDEIGDDADNLRIAVIAAFRPHPDTGVVELTKEEVEEILQKLDLLLEGFGIDLFDEWGEGIEEEEPEEPV